MERARECISAGGGSGGGGGNINSESPQKHIDGKSSDTSGNRGDDDDNTFASDGEGSGRRYAGIGEGPGSAPTSVAEGIRSLIRATWEDVKDWCDEEAEARVRRKDAQVRTICSNRSCALSEVPLNPLPPYGTSFRFTHKPPLTATL